LVLNLRICFYSVHMLYCIYPIMKVYSISKWAFRGICLLILLLPVSRHWRLLSTGKRATGTVTEYVRRMEDPRYPVEASEIEFKVNGVSHKAYGPANYEYKQGRSLKLIYDPKDPARNCVLTFSGFYLSNYSILPLMLITIWYAFYLSFNKYRKKMKMPKGKPRQSGKSPVRSIRPGIHS